MAKYISSYTGAQIDANLALAATAIQPGDYAPETKTSDMTQEVGKDANGKLWTLPRGSDFELIETITLEEAAAAVIRSSEPDGTAYNMKSLFVSVNFPSSYTGSPWIMLNITTQNSPDAKDLTYGGVGSGYLFWANKSYGGGTDVSFTIGALNIGTLTVAWCNHPTTNPASFGDYSGRFGRPMFKVGNIQSVTVTWANGNFEAGTIFKIYGVRA